MKGKSLNMVWAVALTVTTFFGQEAFSAALSVKNAQTPQEYDAYAAVIRQLDGGLQAMLKNIAEQERIRRRVELELSSRLTPDVLVPLFISETIKRGIDPARLRSASLRKTLRLAEDGGISGTVLVEGEPPESEVRILVFDRHGYFAGSAAVDLSTGRYAVAPLKSDSFYVVARSTQYVDAIYENVVSPLASMASWRQAKKVFVPSAVVDNIDFNLKRGVRITGTIAAAGGLPLADGTAVDFRVTTDHDPSPIVSRTVEIVGGRYELVVPATGRFKIRAAVEGYEPRWSGNRTDWAEATIVAINDFTDAPTLDFDLPLQPELPVGEISGVIQPALFALLAVFDATDTSFVRFGFALGLGEVQYALPDLSPGNYFIYADDMLGTLIGAGNSMGEFYDGGEGTRTIIGAKPVTVRAGEPTTDINFVLDPGAVVSGKALLTDGTPLDSLTILLINADLLNGGKEPFITRLEVDVVATEFDGSYQIPGLKPGRYYLRTFSDFFINFSLDEPENLLLDGKHKGKVVDQYYGGESNLLAVTRARKLSIEAPVEVDNINFTLPPACKISGQVTESESGKPADRLCVIALEDSSGYPYFPWATVNESGFYELCALPKGKYKLLALSGFNGKTDLLPEYYGGSRSFYAAQTVEVKSEQIENVNFALKKGAIIEGFVTLPDGRRTGADLQDGIPVVVYEAESGKTASYDFVQFNGGFRIDRLWAGNYKVAVIPPAEFGTTYLGGGVSFDDRLSETITLQYGQVAGDKAIRLINANGMLCGAVTDSSGRPLHGVMVAAYDRSGHMAAFALTGIDMRTGERHKDEGRYEMANLKAGDYYVRTLALFMAASLLEQGLGLIGDLETLDPLALLLGGDLGGLHLDWTFYQDQWYGGVPAVLKVNLDELLFQASSYGLADENDVALTPVFLPLPFHELIPEKAVQAKIAEGAQTTVNFKLGRAKQGEVVVGADDSPIPVRNFVLQQNYPNPFNPQTRVTFALPQDGWVEISIYDAAGRQIGKTLRKHYSAGTHSFVWQGIDHDGRLLAAGIYFLQMKAFEEKKTIKMTFLK